MKVLHIFLSKHTMNAGCFFPSSQSSLIKGQLFQTRISHGEFKCQHSKQVISKVSIFYYTPSSFSGMVFVNSYVVLGILRDFFCTKEQQMHFRGIARLKKKYINDEASSSEWGYGPVHLMQLCNLTKTKDFKSVSCDFLL